MNTQPTPFQDAIELLREDLLIRREDIRHKAEFRGCVKELDRVRDILLNELEDLRTKVQYSDPGKV